MTREAVREGRTGDDAASLRHELVALVSRSCRRGRRRVARVLRRIVDRIDVPDPTPPADVLLISRTELRQIQTDALSMIENYAYLSRTADRRIDGLLWFPRGVLECMGCLVTLELEVRDRDLGLIEKDSTVVLR